MRGTGMLCCRAQWHEVVKGARRAVPVQDKEGAGGKAQKDGHRGYRKRGKPNGFGKNIRYGDFSSGTCVLSEIRKGIGHPAAFAAL